MIWPAELTVLLDKVEKSLVITVGLRNIRCSRVILVELRSDVLRETFLQQCSVFDLLINFEGGCSSGYLRTVGVQWAYLNSLKKCVALFVLG